MAFVPHALPRGRQMGRNGKLWICVVLLASFYFCLHASASGRQKQNNVEILISAAASLKDVVGAIAPAFEKTNPGIKLAFNYGASGQLRIQIENGAPVDVFISAAAADMDALENKGLIDKASRHDIAKNSLVLIHNRTAGPHFQKVEDLLNKAVVRVAIGNPVTVPAGRYAKEALESGSLYDRIKDKLVLGENVRQVLDYVARGEADAGFVYKTDAMTEPKVEIVETIPASRHKPILYPAAVLRTGSNAAAARKFVEYLRSEQARTIFRGYGFE
jgi:molybdate transport system substrate-binding protein